MMGIDAVVEQVLRLRREQFDDIGVTVVRHKDHKPAPIALEGLDVALQRVLDDVVAELATTSERRLVVRSLANSRGAKVEIEYTRGQPPSMGPAGSPARETSCSVIEHAGEYNEMLRNCGGRFFLSFPTGNAARLIIELSPRQSPAPG